ncbi:RNA polymerase subunit sigma-70 [Curtobacterium sp. MCBD17_013]|uniref:RNA polymerase sigma factor n=1 Tax=unclassified Curtobacterium TaxID=257496 RepID=UPI000DA850B6|nr:MULTISPECIES: RNA polymerase sigma factor [unclassified Curtobacterium]PZE76115.1 RNA polymerase subunit sigma-70 [Curtobacterium sp. MCBD17_019]PZF61841.1 RNA polymerase subunit sigma-70 [Curtobacterium sp. MCBD17_013]WIB63315.1 RNA polymerase sigma factor [Curtobacterium sp. MCBD17_040]WIB67153.1 RNA polymerase sigma factor [Curtobacterium sp. MCBD17_035]
MADALDPVAPVTRPVVLEDVDDGLLAERAGDGDVRAFEVLVRRHGPLLRAVAFRALGRTDEVDDVVQDAFVAAWRQLPTMTDPSAIRAWLLRVVARRAADRHRASRPHGELDDDVAAEEHATPHRIVEARSATEAMAAVLADLPERQQRCWLLKEVVGESYEEIAEDLGVPVSTVRGLLSRARRTMMSRMEAWR